MCIKCYPLQDVSEALLNTSLYPSKSQIYIDGIQITLQALYTGTNTILANFIPPTFFNLR